MKGECTLEILKELMEEDLSFKDAVMSREEKRAFIKQLPTGEAFIEGMREVIRNFKT